MRPAPTYWWDFVDNKVVVQSDYTGGERLAEFEILACNSDTAIYLAEKLIADYKAGRKTPNWNKNRE